MNFKSSHDCALVSCRVTPDEGTPAKFPFLSETGDAKFCGVTMFSPKTSSRLWVVVPVVDKVLNFEVSSPPSPSKRIKSSIAPSAISIS